MRKFSMPSAVLSEILI